MGHSPLKVAQIGVETLLDMWVLESDSVRTCCLYRTGHVAFDPPVRDLDSPHY
jgi:hypothetical protein